MKIITLTFRRSVIFFINEKTKKYFLTIRVLQYSVSLSFRGSFNEKSIVIIDVIRFLTPFEMTFWVFCNSLPFGTIQ
jgi:hypothetical protein